MLIDEALTKLNNKIMKIKYAYAQNCKKWRKYYRYTQKDIARLTGTTQALVTQFERGIIWSDILVNFYKGQGVDL